VARQSIPRFDLYAELGVEPSADDGAIEAAYHAQVDRHLPNLDAAATRKRVARLNLARDWLSDSELRSRYDASRARSAARSTAGAAAIRRVASSRPKTTRTPRGRSTKTAPAETSAEAGVIGATALTAAEAAEAEARAAAEAEAAALAPKPLRPEPARSDFSWPAADLERPTSAQVVPKRRSSRRLLLGVAGIAALIAVVALIALALSMPAAPVAVASPTAPAATPTAVPVTPNPTPEPTAAPATEPPPTEAGPPLEQQQQSAWDVIQRLTAAAADGDVDTAQTLLGDSAPGLRASGLKRATFPDIQPGAISTTQEGELYVALAENDRLTSPDGLTWTFDYGDRPLAAYTMAEGIPPYDLYWIESDGKHHLFLEVTAATVSTKGVSVEFAWGYAASRPDDATYFRRASLLITSVAFDDTPVTVDAASMPMRGLTTLTSTVAFTDVEPVPDLITIGVSVSNPRTAGGPPRAVEVGFKLYVH
jgi:hypothetical protein